MKPAVIPFALPPFFIDHIQKDATIHSPEFWLIFNHAQLLVEKDSLQPFQGQHLPLVRSLYLGTFNEFHLHAGETDFSFTPPSQALWVDLKKLYGKINDDLYALAGKAMQLILWDRTHQFCGQCGNKTSERFHERAKECLVCNLLFFPRISPVIMALILRKDEVLLARGIHSSMAFYSTIAGFVEPGETIEQGVKREVFEEVGIEVDHLQYFGSQPWPFSNSLIVAFTCEWKEGEIKIDPSEIADAQWFKKENLPLLPPEMSIARILIDTILKNQ